MPDASAGYRIEWHLRMADIDAAEWDRLALPLATPLLEWTWLHELEASGSIVPDTGWQPAHLTVWHGDRLAGAAPLYVKHDSEGEFFFDHYWQLAAETYGLRYLPKLVGMSPVTPMSGYQFLVDPAEDGPGMIRFMTAAIDRFCADNGIGSCHLLYLENGWHPAAEAAGFIPCLHQGFLWINDGYAAFADYLAAFNTNQRRNIRKERAILDKQRISMRVLEGDDIPEHLIPLLYRYYAQTNDQHGPWSCKYLTPAFFGRIHARCRHRLVIAAAYHEKFARHPAGMALLLRKGDRLLGRYWGAAAPIRHLHFNTCYYAPIQWAVENGIRTFDPGLGGAHKVRRGFQAVPVVSLHRFYDPTLVRLMAAMIRRESADAGDRIAAINRALPFRKEPS